MFGCLCYITNNIPHKGKFDPRADPCVFSGYSFNQKGYKVFNLRTHSTQVSRDVTFHEDIFPYKDTPHQTDLSMPMGSAPIVKLNQSDPDYFPHPQLNLLMTMRRVMRQIPSTVKLKHQFLITRNLQGSQTGSEIYQEIYMIMSMRYPSQTRLDIPYLLM